MTIKRGDEMNTIGKTLKYVDEQGMEREFCATVCDNHVLVGDGSRTLREELASIKRRLSSSPASAIYPLHQMETPFHWNKGITDEDLAVELSTQEAKLSNVRLTVNPLAQSYRAMNLFYGKNFFEEDVDGNGIPDEWTPHTHGVVCENKPNRGVVSIKNGKLLLDASQATTMTNELGVSIPIGHLLRKGHQYIAVVRLGMSQPTSTLTRLQYYGMTEDNCCISTGGTDLGSRKETVFYFDPFSKWFDKYPSQPVEMESFKLDIFIKGTGRVYVEQVALYELPCDFYGTPNFSLFDSESEFVAWQKPVEMPPGVRIVSVSPIKEQYETRVLFTEPINPDAAVPDVVSISEGKLYRYVDENGDVMAKPITYPIQVEGDKIEDHWGLCDISYLGYEEELRCSSHLVRYELKSLQDDEPWFEADEMTFYDAKYYHKRILCSHDSKLGLKVDYDYEAASHSQRLEASYLQLLKHEIIMNEVVKVSEETKQAVEGISEDVKRLEEVVKNLDIEQIDVIKEDLKEVKEQVEEIQSEIDQPINESDVDDIIGIIKGVN